MSGSREHGRDWGCGPGAPLSSLGPVNIPGSLEVPAGVGGFASPGHGSQSFPLSGPGRKRRRVCPAGGQREGCAGRPAPLSSPAKASFPKKEPFEAAVAGQAGSGALPRGTRGRFTHSLASPASHAPGVHTLRPLLRCVYTEVRAPQTSPGLRGPDPITVTHQRPLTLHVAKTALAWHPFFSLLPMSSFACLVCVKLLLVLPSYS